MQRYILFFILSFIIVIGNDINANAYTTPSTPFAAQDAPTMSEMSIKPDIQEMTPEIKKDEGCKCQSAIDELKQENKQLYEELHNEIRTNQNRAEEFKQKIASLEKKCSDNTVLFWSMAIGLTIVGIIMGRE